MNFHFSIITIFLFVSCADSRLHVLDSCTNPLDKNLANLITGGIIAENHCPQSPEVSYKDIQLGEELRGPLDDFNVYVAERLLQLSGDELTINDFFSIYQVILQDCNYIRIDSDFHVHAMGHIQWNSSIKYLRQFEVSRLSVNIIALIQFTIGTTESVFIIMYVLF